MNVDPLFAIVIGLQCLNIIFHVGGLYLLHNFSKMGKGDVQLQLVANLSLTEVFLNLSYIFIFSCSLFPENTTAHRMLEYVDIFSGSALKFVYYFTMLFLTLNKLLEVYLSIQYGNHCNKRRTKILLCITWVVAFFFFLSITICQIMDDQSKEKQNANITRILTTTLKPALHQPEKQEENLHNTVYNYFYTILDILFILIAVSTHSFIFHKYRMSRLDPPLVRKCSMYARKRKESTWKVFRYSRFYVSCLLIITFIFMVVLPKLIYFFVWEYIRDEIFRDIVYVSVGFLYYLSFLVDVFIYVFMHPPLKRLLWKKLRKVKLLPDFISDGRKEFDGTAKTTML